MAYLPDFQGPGSSVLLPLLVCLNGITELPEVPILEVTFSSLPLKVHHPLILSQPFSIPTCQPEPRMRYWSPVPNTPFRPTSCLRSGGLRSLEWHCPSTVLQILRRPRSYLASDFTSSLKALRLYCPWMAPSPYIQMAAPLLWTSLTAWCPKFGYCCFSYSIRLIIRLILQPTAQLILSLCAYRIGTPTLEGNPHLAHESHCLHKSHHP